MAPILKVWRHIRKLLQINSGINRGKFHHDQIWNDGASGFFGSARPNKNKNKMSIDIGSASFNYRLKTLKLCDGSMRSSGRVLACLRVKTSWCLRSPFCAAWWRLLVDETILYSFTTSHHRKSHNGNYWRRRRLLYTRIMALFSCALHAPNSCAPAEANAQPGAVTGDCMTTWALHGATHVAAFAVSPPLLSILARAGPFHNIIFASLLLYSNRFVVNLLRITEYGTCYLC